MAQITLKFKKLTPDAVTPTKAHESDAAFDLTAVRKRRMFNYVEYGTGLAFDIPPGHCILLFQRSSVSNTGMMLSNAIGLVDSGFSGEVTARFKTLTDAGEYEVGQRILQAMLLPIPIVSLEEVTDLPLTARGDKGYGSSGK